MPRKIQLYFLIMCYTLAPFQIINICKYSLRQLILYLIKTPTCMNFEQALIVVNIMSTLNKVRRVCKSRPKLILICVSQAETSFNATQCYSRSTKFRSFRCTSHTYLLIYM